MINMEKCNDCKGEIDDSEFMKYGGLCGKCYKKRHPDDYKIEDSGQHREFLTGAKRDKKAGKGSFDLLPPATIRALAIHYQKGAEKYARRNWEKGIAVSEYIDSGLRHAFEFMDGLDDENHLISCIWNFVCAYETILRIQKGELPEELYDFPKKAKLPSPYQKPNEKPNGT